MSPAKVGKVSKKSKKESVTDLAARIRLRALEANQKRVLQQELTEKEEKEVDAESDDSKKDDDTKEDVKEESSPEITSFSQLKLIPELLESCEKLNFTKPTPIQAEAIPHALEGHDIIGLAQTGSGKTAAFAIPILQSLWHAQTPYFACVLAPTRELAYQIRETFDALGSNMGLRCVTVVGGMDMMDQARDLMRKPHIIVATPGRLMDHLEHTKGFSLRLLKYLVMDEADRLLDMDFGPALDKILKIIPKERTTYLFSATMTGKIEKLQRASLSNPVNVAVSDKYATVDTLIQRMMMISVDKKDTLLIYLLNEYYGKSIIIFARTCAHVQRTALLARILGFSAIPLHGDMSQLQRLGSLNKFKSGERQILVATDVAARGLDIPSVDIVINYDMPTDSKLYIHRVGRTARAGKSGKSISLVTQYDVEYLLRTESVIGMKIPAEKIDQDLILSLRNSVDRALSEAVRQTKEFHDKRKDFSGHNRKRHDNKGKR